MKTSQKTFSLLVASFSIFFTGCYTQLQSMEYGQTHKRGLHAQAYTAPELDQEEYDAYYETDEQENSAYVDSSLTEEELAELGVYYKDYETQEWYEEHFIDQVYWDGYEAGYADGFHDFDDNYWFYSSGYRSLRYYGGGYYGFAYNRGFHRASFSFYVGSAYGCSGYFPIYYEYINGYRYPVWGYCDPYWDPYPYHVGWGWGWNRNYYSPYRPLYAAYNDYHRNQRSAPRSAGLVSRGNGANSNSGITRSRTPNDGVVTTTRSRTGTGSSMTRSRTGSTTGTTVRRGTSSTGRSTTGVRTRTGTTGRTSGSSGVRSGSTGRTSGSSGVRSGSSSGRTSGSSGVRSGSSGRSSGSSGVRSGSSTRSSGRSGVRSSSGSSRSSGVRSSSGSRSSSRGRSSSSRGSSSRRGG